jgi:hypothetical protein
LSTQTICLSDQLLRDLDATATDSADEIFGLLALGIGIFEVDPPVSPSVSVCLGQAGRNGIGSSNQLTTQVTQPTGVLQHEDLLGHAVCDLPGDKL